MQRSVVLFLAVPVLLAMLELAEGQLNLPDMPGPPYPDKYGNNRWGVKYDPRVHGRGRQQSAPSSSSGFYGGGSSGSSEEPEELPPSRYRNPSQSPPRTRWSPGLKPLVSNFFRNRRPSALHSILSSFSPTSDKRPNSVKMMDGYVKNYMNTYNSVAKAPAASDLVNIQTFQQSFNRPTNNANNNRNNNNNNNNMNDRFKPNNFALNGNRPSHLQSDPSVLSNMAMSFVRTARSDTPLYRTVNPQTDFFPGRDAKISRKQSTSGRNFAKTLSNIYTDYKPGEENTASASDSRGTARQASDEYYESAGLPPPSRPRGPSSSSGPVYVEKPYFSSSSDSSYRKRPPGGPPPPLGRGSRGPPPSRLSSSYSSGSPLSSLDLYDDTPTYSSGGPSTYSSGGPSSYSSGGLPSSGPYGSAEYSDSPMILTSSGGGSSDYLSSSGPVTVTSYSMSGPPPPPSSPYSSSPYPSSLSSGPGPYSSSPYDSYSAPPPPPPPPPPHMLSSPIAPLSYMPPYYAPPAYPPHSPPPSPYKHKSKKHKKSKRKKNKFQHTPMNVIRGLLGRGERRERNRERDYEREYDDEEPYRPEYAANIPLSLPPPSQYSYPHPIPNSLPSSAVDYLGPPRLPDYPPPRPYPGASPLSLGILSLRDTLTGLNRPYPYRPPTPPPPPSSRSPSGPSGGDGSTNDINQENNYPPPPKHNPDRPITQHLQDWPRIFTAMGSSVDAVAGGIHAVRKELSKATGQVMAKGIMMSGSAVNEVSRGMAHMITKMSSI